ncbi:hypothetical protein ABZW30_47050 [Kitasatospora sp. NPDC004669]|uniref:hypothetical protein n=1 Tax=Kitasatospora sp. NPDC004669 TaxID=3154555 RepID=UPI0033B7051C
MGGDSDKLAFTPTLLTATAEDFLADRRVLREECFGPASLVITYPGQADPYEVLASLEPGLTATVHGEPDETELVRGLLPSLTRLVGRLLWNNRPASP